MPTPSDTARPSSWDGAWNRAFELARRGLGRVSPNPPVGAVILRDDRIIGEGWHHAYGEAHAEREAIADAEARGEAVAGATMLVTLEPCGHEGRQPPCADLLVEKGLAEVVFGCEDPSEKTAGVGPQLLLRSGVAVSIASDAVAAHARSLTRGFRKHCATGRPSVMLKMAMSLDGRVAGASGEPIHLTCPESDAQVHAWRSELDAIAIGAGTLASDDPRLTARGSSGVPQPSRVVFLGSSGPESLPDGTEAVFGDLPSAPLVFVLDRLPKPGSAAATTIEEIVGLGAEVVETGPGTPTERFREALERLAETGIRTVMLEGGPGLAATAILAGEVDELELFVAPVVLGAGPGAFDHLAGRIDEGPVPGEMAVSVSGRDVRLSSVLREW